MVKKERVKFQPCSEKQRLILMDNTTDVILIGGGELCASALKTTS